MSFPEFPLDAAMSRSYFEAIIPEKRTSSPRSSFSSGRTLVNVSQPAASNAASNTPPFSRTTTSTTTTTKSTDASTSSQGKRKRMKSFLKRLGNGMLESLAYTGGAGIDYVPTGMPTRAGMDRRSNDQVLGDVYGVQLMIW